jgi:hypothetical protein
MNKLPLDIEENFQNAQLYKALLIALQLLEQADNDNMQHIAGASIEAIITAWHDTTDPTEN